MVLLGIAARAAFLASPVAHAEVATGGLGGCPKVVLYFARGSGQKLTPETRGFASPGIQLYDDLQKRYGPGVVGTMADAYPAVAVTLSVFGRNVFNPFVLPGYLKSAEGGVQSAVQNIADLAMLCPGSWLVLGGYSQGAQVIRTALAQLGEAERERVAAATLFGDPYFSASEPNVLTLSSFNPKQSGALRSLRPSGAPAIGARYDGRVYSWCHKHDIVCQGPDFGKNGAASHATYGEDAEDAATRVAGRLAALGLRPALTGGATSAFVLAYRVSGTCVTGTCGLAQWSGPGTNGFHAQGAVYEGQEVRVACQVRGQLMVGPSGRTSAIWDRLDDGAFVSDLYLTTPAVGQFSSTLPPCRGLEVASP